MLKTKEKRKKAAWNKAYKRIYLNLYTQAIQKQQKRSKKERKERKNNNKVTTQPEQHKS